MAATDHGIPIMRTKIHRPAVDADHIHRPSLLARLDENRHRPLTLISAPAGYGKSTLASGWLASTQVPGAWVSLDETDNDPRFFLAYVLAAVQSIFPGRLPNTQNLVNAPTLPPLSVLSQSLINELDAIDTDFILVLDDYHLIKEKGVHDLLCLLLKYPPAPMHHSAGIPLRAAAAHRFISRAATDGRYTHPGSALFPRRDQRLS